MKLSLSLSGLFTASLLWCQGFSLAADASTNEVDSLGSKVDVASYRHLLQDVGNSTLENNMAKDDMSIVQKSQSVETLIGKWVQRGDTVSSDETLVRENEEFGFSVALNKRGRRLVVSAPKAKANSNPVNPESGYDGKIEIYDLVNSQWNLVQTIFGDAGTIEGSKGLDVSITPKGNHIAVHNGGNYTTGGSFSVYEKNDTNGLFSLLGSTISETSSDGSYSSSFGRGIEISRNGKRVALGNPNYGDNMRGKAYVYEYDSVTSKWKIVFDITWPGEHAIGYLGSDVSLSADGKSIAVIATSGNAVAAWSVDVFEEDASSNWIRSSLPLTDPVANLEGVSMSANGMRIALSNSFLNYNIGGTYVFDKVGPNWVLNENTPLMGTGRHGTDYCGREVVISADGTKVIMTCSGIGVDEGYAIVYREHESGAWSQDGDIILKYPSIEGSAVYSVAMADKVGGENAATIVAVGSPTFEFGDSVGSAAVYKLESIPCINSNAEMRMDTMNMDVIPFFCKWVNKGQGSTCGEFGHLKDHCPDSCGTCAEYGCSDSTATFIVNGGETTCMDLMVFDEPLVGILCKKEQIRTSCRATCGYCGVINPSYPDP